MPKSEKFQQLPAPWDRIFSLFTRVFVWALLLTILYILRPFFLLIFLTFVFAYIQSHGVEGLAHRFKSRVYRVILVFIIFLGVIVGTLYFLAPHVRHQMTEFVKNYPTYATQADNAFYNYMDANPWLKRIVEGKAEKPKKDANGKGSEGKGSEGENNERKKGQAPKPTPKKQEPEEKLEPKEPKPIVEPFVLQLLGLGGEKSIEAASTSFSAILGGIVGTTSSFLLSILFSFLIVLDLPRLSRSVRGLARTRLDFIYEEVADNIYHFGKRLGRALEAQLFIAICNTIFTAIGVYFMGLQSIVFLSTIVFFCSFIPVAGVFISSAPICLLALQTGGKEDGVQLMLVAIAFITLIHVIEAYILNPKIYGHHLHMNSVLVLIVLTIAGKLVGVWGLVLGIPVVNYIFGTAIRHKTEDDPDSLERLAVPADANLPPPTEHAEDSPRPPG